MPDEKKPATLLEAVVAVQGEVGTLPKDAVNPHFKSKFTPLDTIVERVGPVLAKNGLSWRAFPSSDEQGRPVLKYRLSHVSGETEEDAMPLLMGKQDMQGLGSAITYARRYALCAVLNLVADEDDDGNQTQAPKPADLARAKSRMSQRAQELHTKAISISGWVDEDVLQRWMDATGYTEDGLERLVAHLEKNRPKETADA